SLLASLATLMVLHRLGQRHIGNDGSILLPLVWLMLVQPASLAVMCRPYAIGMFFGVLSMYLCLNWLQTETTKAFVLFVAVAIMPFYFSFMFALTLAAYAAYLIWLYVKDRRITASKILSAILLWTLSFLPLLKQMLMTPTNSSLRGITNEIRNRNDLILALIPVSLACCDLIALTTTLICSDQPKPGRSRREMLVLFMLLTICSILPLYFVTQLTSAKLWAPRYFSVAFAPLAVLHTLVLLCFSGATGRLLGVAAA